MFDGIRLILEIMYLCIGKRRLPFLNNIEVKFYYSFLVITIIMNNIVYLNMHSKSSYYKIQYIPLPTEKMFFLYCIKFILKIPQITSTPI